MSRGRSSNNLSTASKKYSTIQKNFNSPSRTDFSKPSVPSNVFGQQKRSSYLNTSKPKEIPKIEDEKSEEYFEEKYVEDNQIEPEEIQDIIADKSSAEEVIKKFK
jgi:hypothetical protein